MEIGMTTAEVAMLFHVKPNTVRVSLCHRGHYFGIRPTKLGNRLLSWPRAEVFAALYSENGRSVESSQNQK